MKSEKFSRQAAISFTYTVGQSVIKHTNVDVDQQLVDCSGAEFDQIKQQAEILSNRLKKHA